MKHVMIVAALLFAGCSKKSSGPSCADAIDKALSAMPGGPGGGDEVKGKLRAIYVKHCTDDKWSADVINCYANDVKDMPSMKACRSKMTQDQQDKLMTDVRATMAGAMGAMGGGGGGMGGGGPMHGGPGTGAPPAGSDSAPPAGSAAP